ncbi:S-adenosylmethionine-dependent methyltransferase [Emydomyces testavorans]|uniref:carnosine N-methyltransferase n=1 Tax=Emydomyces testavorans TaxID=2070801 RepID=A0AAF0DA96_9EURO|nr:S-adenosylmethionine-dependent methyltransferase [Emydomyces testavorans]
MSVSMDAARETNHQRDDREQEPRALNHLDSEHEEWAGEYDPFSDPQERKVLFAALDSFRQYRRFLHRNITHRRRQSFYSLPSSHWTKLANPPFSILDTFNNIDDAIDTNADIAEAILATGLASFGLPPNPAENDSRNWRDKATPEDISKANSTIRQFFRDWSAEGQHERDISYGPVLRALQEQFGERPASGIRVLVPGAGLGRLVFDLSVAGYAAEGNEFSYHQLIASSWVLNHTRKAGEFALYPFALGFSNLKSRKQQLKKVMIPDVHPGSVVKEQDLLPVNERTMGIMSMTAADFLIQYAESESKDAFDAVATVFFIDTAPNLIRYIETIQNCLKPGGLWINVGPLLWHYEDRHNGSQSKSEGADTDDVEKLGIVEPGTVEFTEEEVFHLVESMGFDIRIHNDEVGECGYIQDPESMLQNTYRPSHWVAVKR